MPRVKQRTPELRAKVVETALAALAADGVEGFTTRRVARGADTSIPAVYELFGDRAGLLREVFFEGFRKLRGHFDGLLDTADARSDLLAVVGSLRGFVRDNPTLAELMFSRPFSDFDPAREEIEAGSSVREFIVGHVQRCIEAGLVEGDATDLSHVLLALAQGLAAQERAGWLGRSAASMDRRWELAFRTLLDGAASGSSSGG